MSFYYNPLSFNQILNSRSIVLGVSIVADAHKTLGAFYKELTGDEETKERTHATKTFLRNFPLFNQGVTFFLPLIDPETAKEMGVVVSEESRRH